MSSVPAIELAHISKNYQVGARSLLWKKNVVSKQALDDVTFTVDPGEVCCLLGLNGAGKTTLIKILATLVLPDSGDAKVQGHSLLTAPERVRPLVGMVNSNERSFYWRLPLRKNLEFFGVLQGLKGRAGSKRLDVVLDLVELADVADKRFDTCSTGQKQRAAIARALLSDPQVLLLDEPTSNIDVLSAERLRTFIRETLIKGSGKAALWCTHNLHEAQEVCDRVLVLHQGRLVANHTFQELQQTLAYKHYLLTVQGYTSELDVQVPVEIERITQQGAHQILQVLAREEDIPMVLNALVHNGVRVYECRPERPDLESMFTRIVTEAVC